MYLQVRLRFHHPHIKNNAVMYICNKAVKMDFVSSREIQVLPVKYLSFISVGSETIFQILRKH